MVGCGCRGGCGCVYVWGCVGGCVCVCTPVIAHIWRHLSVLCNLTLGHVPRRRDLMS